MEPTISYFASYAGIAALVLLLTALLVNLFKIESSSAKQYMSWGLSVVLVAVAVLLGAFENFGIFSGFEASNWYDWVNAIAVAIGCGLSSNGLYDWNVIQKFLESIGLLKSNPNN